MRKGFTLTELMVSVSLVALLAGLLLPVAAKARSAALRARCTSQMRQLGLAFLSYASDSGGLLPHEDNGDGQPPYGCGWFEVLPAYLGGQECRQCGGLSVNPSWRSVKMNSLLEEGAVDFLGLAEVGDASRTVLAFDGRVENQGVRMLPKGDWDSAAPRHGAGTLCLFCDGGVRFVPARFDAAGWTDANGILWRP